MSTDILDFTVNVAHTDIALLDPTAAARALMRGAAVIDTRPAVAFDAGHPAGALNVPGGDDAGAVAARLMALDVPVIALAERQSDARRAAARIIAAGFRSVLGAVSGIHAGAALGHVPLECSGAIDLPRLADELGTGAVLLVDVRDEWEWSRGRLAGSVHLPLADLRAAAHLLPHVPIVTACSDGRRAAAAASALRRWGHQNVWRATGGGVAELLERPIGLDLLGAA